jgi:transposase-like protein
MTEKLVDMSPSTTETSQQPSAEELETARELVRQARTRGVALTGPQGLLKTLTKTVIETALDEEMSEHLGYDKHESVGVHRRDHGQGPRRSGR